MKRYFFLFLLFFNACRFENKMTSALPEENLEILNTPSLRLSVSVPQDILYVSEAPSFSSQKRLYRAVGDGGLGGDFDQHSSLIPYSGIPLALKFENISKKPQVFLEVQPATLSNNDTYCSQLFYYNESSKLIEININNLVGYSVCYLTIFAQSTEQKIYSNKVSFYVTLNFTFGDYLKNNDPVAKIIQEKSGISAEDFQKKLLFLSKYLKDNSNNNALNLSFNSEMLFSPFEVESVDSLTGLQSLRSLSLSQTKLTSLSAVSWFKNLETLDVSGTLISEFEFKHLKKLKKLKNLILQNLDITDAQSFLPYLYHIENLDISENTRIKNLDDMKNLTSLRFLRLSHVGLNSLSFLEYFTQLRFLDISKNDLSSLSEFSYPFLSNLYNLQHLNLSFTKISDEFLNNYFNTVQAQKLKSFINRNNFYPQKIGGCDFNNFEKIFNFQKLISLEYLDISGNSCQTAEGLYEGLVSTKPFVNMKKLQTLNISKNIISHISHLTELKNTKIIFNEKDSQSNSFLKENGIFVSAEHCFSVLGKNKEECETLTGASQMMTLKFYEPGAHSWSVPQHVHKIHVRGASASNGGGGGGGSGASNNCYYGTWGCYTRGGDGGAGGQANGLDFKNQGAAGVACNYNLIYEVSSSGTSAFSGNLGEPTFFQDFLFPTAHPDHTEEFVLDSSLLWPGGAGGQGGGSRYGVCDDSAGYGSNTGGAGGHGQTGWNSVIQTFEISVKSFEVISFFVGKGGEGGQKGLGGLTPWTQKMFYRNDGLSGENGAAGKDGFIEITYEVYLP